MSETVEELDVTFKTIANQSCEHLIKVLEEQHMRTVSQILTGVEEDVKKYDELMSESPLSKKEIRGQFSVKIGLRRQALLALERLLEVLDERLFDGLVETCASIERTDTEGLRALLNLNADIIEIYGKFQIEYNVLNAAEEHDTVRREIKQRIDAVDQILKETPRRLKRKLSKSALLSGGASLVSAAAGASALYGAGKTIVTYKVDKFTGNRIKQFMEDWRRQYLDFQKLTWRASLMGPEHVLAHVLPEEQPHVRQMLDMIQSYEDQKSLQKYAREVLDLPVLQMLLFTKEYKKPVFKLTWDPNAVMQQYDFQVVESVDKLVMKHTYAMKNLEMIKANTVNDVLQVEDYLQTFMNMAWMLFFLSWMFGRYTVKDVKEARKKEDEQFLQPVLQSIRQLPVLRQQAEAELGETGMLFESELVPIEQLIKDREDLPAIQELTEKSRLMQSRIKSQSARYKPSVSKSRGRMTHRMRSCRKGSRRVVRKTVRK